MTAERQRNTDITSNMLTLLSLLLLLSLLSLLLMP
jgi:hypothetical protein